MMTPTFLGWAALRGIDWGKWSDVKKFLELIGYGMVCNLSMVLSPWGSGGRMKGVEVAARVMPMARQQGRVIVNAGSDPSYDALVSAADLAGGQFNVKELVLCILSMLDLDPLRENDLHIDLISPALPGASLGTSASVLVAILSAFLGDSYTADEIWLMALRAEYEIARRNTGNQDHIAAIMGAREEIKTPARLITINDLFDVEIEHLVVGPMISAVLPNTLVSVIGAHDSSDTHQRLQDELEGDPEMARDKLCAMRNTAVMAANAFRSDSPDQLFASIDALLAAQQSLSTGLIGPFHWKIIQDARAYGGYSGVPGAGGDGGSVITVFQEADSMRCFAESIQLALPDIRLFQAGYPGINFV